MKFSPTKSIPDVAAFLSHIGRNCSEFAEAFPSWDALLNAKSKNLKTAGVDIKSRRYILAQVEKFKQSQVLGNDVFTATKEIKILKKKNGGERKLNQYLSNKNILQRIDQAKHIKNFKKSNNLKNLTYNKFDKLHENLNHNL